MRWLQIVGLDAQLIDQTGGRELLRTHVLRLLSVYRSARVLVVIERNLVGVPFFIAGHIGDVTAVDFFQESEKAGDFGFYKTNEVFSAAISTASGALCRGLIAFSRDLISVGIAGAAATMTKFRSQASRYTIDVKSRDYPVTRPRGLYDLIESFLINVSVSHSIARGAFTGFNRDYVLN